MLEESLLHPVSMKHFAIAGQKNNISRQFTQENLLFLTIGQ